MPVNRCGQCSHYRPVPQKRYFYCQESEQLQWIYSEGSCYWNGARFTNETCERQEG